MSSGDAAAPTFGAAPTRLRASLARARRGAGARPSVGQWLGFPGYSLARTVAAVGNDWVLIDCEHGDIDDAAMYHSIGAVVASGSSPVVRIAADQQWMVKRARDAGAHGIMVPMCETVEQAQAISNASKYPSREYPKGCRGAGTMVANMSFGQDVRGYYGSANKNVVVILQIESRKGVENCEDIAKVDGIDMLFIGPNDLASSMGYFPLDHASIPEVQEATVRVLKAAHDAGKYAGHFALGAEIAAQRAKQGFEFVNYGADIVAINAWMSSERAKLEKLLLE